jgi:predicted Mrr-cat superfamily restriction endonuclease
MGDQDYVIVPDGPVVYVGRVISPYKYDASVDSDEIGFPHQREVEWFYDKKAIPRNLLTGRVYNSLKGRQTIFSTYHDDIDEIIKNKKSYFTKEPDFSLKIEYLKRLQSGILRNVNPNTFEDAVCILYSEYFPGLRRLPTTNSKEGDTDLLAELPGNVNVRIQVKHFFPDQGEVEDWVVDQLVDSMVPGDHGIIVTSGVISKSARKRALQIPDKPVSFIDGEEFVELLFGAIDSMPRETLVTFGLASEIAFL